MTKGTSMTQRREIPCILILDLSDDNHADERSVSPLLSGGGEQARVYRATEFGAERAPRGNPPDRVGVEATWRAWTGAVDQMVVKAQRDLGDDCQFAHYYVAGRAALPICAYLGMRLGKQARVTVCNQPPDTDVWQQFPLQVSAPTAAASHTAARFRFFDRVTGLDADAPREADGMVAVFVATQNQADPEPIRAFARTHGVQLAGIAMIQARSQNAGEGFRLMSEADSAGAASELHQHFTRIKDCYPYHSGVIVCIAGPVQLAVMVGRAINPHMYAPVYFPNFVNRSVYVPAVENPWPLVSGGRPRFLITIANPPSSKQPPLEVNKSMQTIVKRIEENTSEDGYDIKQLTAVDVESLMDKLDSFRPHVFHFGGHGTVQGPVLVGRDGREHFVPDGALHDLIATTCGELNLIVLNACDAGTQAESLKQLADCVICMSSEIHDDAACLFADRFYRALACCRSVQDAYLQAKTYVEASGHCADMIKLVVRDHRNANEIYFFSPSQRRS